MRKYIPNLTAPLKLDDPEFKAKFLEAIRIGGSYRIACQYAGCSYQIFCLWRQLVSEDRIKELPEGKAELILEFLDEVDKAEGQGAIKSLGKIDDGENNWQSAAWKMERRYASEYGKEREIGDEVAKVQKDIQEVKSLIEKNR